MQQKHIIL